MALIVVISAAITIDMCNSMADGMPMEGGRTMSMSLMRMPEESWWGASTRFLGMRIAMMVAMMLPSIAAVLWRYRQMLDLTAATRNSYHAARERSISAAHRDLAFESVCGAARAAAT